MTLAPSVSITPPDMIFDQSGIDTTNAMKMSLLVPAEGFVLTQRRTLTTLLAPLTDDAGPDNGLIDGFSGTISWGIYSSVNGEPGTLLFSGSDNTPQMVDTGLSFSGTTDDVVMATIDLGSVTLDPGSYFLALHEGVWGSPNDGSEIYWMKTSTDLGVNGFHFTPNTANPSNWSFDVPGGSAAFTLKGVAIEQVAFNLKGSISVSDADVGGNTMMVTLNVGYGILTVSAGTSGANVAGSGTGTVILTGTLAQINDLLGTNATSSVSFTANTDVPPASTVLTVTAQEPGDAAPSAPATQTITIAAVNDAPAVSISPSGTLFNQSSLDVTNANGISNAVNSDSFALTERRTLGTITAALNDNGPNNGALDGFSGTLSWGIYSSVSGAPGALLFSGTDSTPLLVDSGQNLFDGTDIILATIDLGNVTLDAGEYFIALHEGAWGSAYDNTQIFWVRTSAPQDAVGSQASFNLANPSGWSSEGYSYAFSLAGPSYAATEQVALDLKGRVVVADDSGSNSITVTLNVGYGILTVTAGSSGANVSGSGTGTVTLTGTLAQINDLLGSNATSSIGFTANTDTPPASTTLSVNVNDGGNSGSGGALTGSATQTITIAAVNDAPTAVVSASAYAATEQVALNLKGTVSVADADAGSGSVTVTLGVGYGVLTVTAGSSGANVSGSGTNSVTLTGTLAQINDLLGSNATSSVSFTANTDAPPANTTLTVGVNDGGNSGSGGALTGSASQTINIAAVNDAPVISNLSGDSVTWTEGNGSLLIDAGGNAAITDADSTNFDGGTLTVSITGGLVSAQDQLVIIPDAFITLGAPLPGGDRQVYYNGTQIGLVAGGGAGGTALSFTFYDPDGRPAPPVGAVQALLRTIGYTNSGGDAPSAGARTISWTLNDGDGGTTTVTSTVNVAAVNDAPTAAVSASAYAATEQVVLNLKGTVSVADVDAASGSITVTLGVGYGILTVTAGSSGANVSGSGTSSVTLTGTLAQINDLLGTNATSSIGFTANTDTPPASTTLSVGINDGGNSGSGGALTGSASQTINIAAVNDAPTAAVSPSAYAATEQVALNLKGTVSVADADAGSGSVTVTLGVGYGILTVTAGSSGANVSGSGTNSVTLTGTLAQINDLLGANATSSVSFTANTDTPPASTTLSVGINDGGNSGNGGALTGAANQTITITAVNDLPVAVGDVYSTNEDVPLIIAGPGVLTNDSDVDGDALTAVLVTGPSHGTLTLNPNGSFTYTPDANYNGGDSFSYRPNDGTANGPPTTVTLTVNAVNDAPANLVIDSDRVNEGAPAGTIVGTASANDVDGDPIIWSLSGADAGLFQIDGSGVITTTGTTANFESRPSYSLTVRAADAGGLFTEQALAVVVNDRPVAVADALAIDEGKTSANLWSTLLGNDTDGNGDALTIVSVNSVGTGGHVIFDAATQSLKYVADAAAFDLLSPGQTLTDSFKYTVTDAGGLTSTATATFTVTAIVDGVQVVGGGRNGNVLTGTADEDRLYGFAGNQSLNGGAGDDTLIGGAGNDTLTGGTGKDVFIINFQDGHDVITDYTPGQDVIDLAAGMDILSSVAADTNGDTIVDLTINLELGGSVTLLGISSIGQVTFA